jgi:hypothetical protein
MLHKAPPVEDLLADLTRDLESIMVAIYSESRQHNLPDRTS